MAYAFIGDYADAHIGLELLHIILPRPEKGSKGTKAITTNKQNDMNLMIFIRPWHEMHLLWDLPAKHESYKSSIYQKHQLTFPCKHPKQLGAFSQWMHIALQHIYGIGRQNYTTLRF